MPSLQSEHIWILLGVCEPAIKHYFSARWATIRSEDLKSAVSLLQEPETNGSLGPIGGVACDMFRVESPDTLCVFVQYSTLGLLKNLKLIFPI